MGEQYNNNVEELVLNATDIDIKQSSMLDLAENTVLRLPLYNGRLLTEAEQKAAYDEGMAKSNQGVFFNIMKNCLQEQQTTEEGINKGIKTCKLALPDWDNEKIQSELTAIQKDLDIDLNISDIFLNIEVMEKIKNKDLRGAYILFSKNETVSDEEKPLEFMKKVAKTLGTDDDTINGAIEIVASIDSRGDEPDFKAKLLQSTMQTEEYKKAFEAGQGKSQENTK